MMVVVVTVTTASTFWDSHKCNKAKSTDGSTAHSPLPQCQPAPTTHCSQPRKDHCCGQAQIVPGKWWVLSKRLNGEISNRSILRGVLAYSLFHHQMTLITIPYFISSSCSKEPWEEGRTGVITPSPSLQRLEPGSQKECSNQGQNSNFLTSISVFFATHSTSLHSHKHSDCAIVLIKNLQ